MAKDRFVVAKDPYFVTVPTVGIDEFEPGWNFWMWEYGDLKEEIASFLPLGCMAFVLTYKLKINDGLEGVGQYAFSSDDSGKYGIILCRMGYSSPETGQRIWEDWSLLPDPSIFQAFITN